MSDSPKYTEFPGDEIVAVHFKKKDNGGPPDTGGDPYAYCGMFENGLVPGAPIGFSGLYTLAPDNMYMHIPDGNPGHALDKPWMYFPCFQDYVTMRLATVRPYVWHAPEKWTLTWQPSAAAPDAIARYKIWRNTNPQLFGNMLSDPPPPDQIIEGPVATIPYVDVDTEYYWPMFIIETKFGSVDWHTTPYPHVSVQAHCQFTTLGALPPQPPGWGTFFDIDSLWVYPMPGSINDPLHPPPVPPPLRYRVEPLPHRHALDPHNFVGGCC